MKANTPATRLDSIQVRKSSKPDDMYLLVRESMMTNVTMPIRMVAVRILPHGHFILFGGGVVGVFASVSLLML